MLLAAAVSGRRRPEHPLWPLCLYTNNGEVGAQSSFMGMRTGRQLLGIQLRAGGGAGNERQAGMQGRGKSVVKSAQTFPVPQRLPSTRPC